MLEKPLLGLSCVDAWVVGLYGNKNWDPTYWTSPELIWSLSMHLDARTQPSLASDLYSHRRNSQGKLEWRRVEASLFLPFCFCLNYYYYFHVRLLFFSFFLSWFNWGTPFGRWENVGRERKETMSRDFLFYEAEGKWRSRKQSVFYVACVAQARAGNEIRLLKPCRNN